MERILEERRINCDVIKRAKYAAGRAIPDVLVQYGNDV
jgi:hypothetical protein